MQTSGARALFVFRHAAPLRQPGGMQTTVNLTALVTGAAGFMGSHVVDNLLESDFNVVGMDDLSGGFVDNVNPQSTFVQGSITDSNLVQVLFSKYRFDYVFHLAAYAAENLSHFIRRFNYNNNLLGSVNLINASVNHNVRCFVFTSSIAVYGEPVNLPVTEEMTPAPEDCYGVAKYAVELDLQAANKMFDLPYIIFRPHNVYGERQNIGDKYRNVIGIFINSALRGMPLPIFGDGQQTRGFSHIVDVAPVIARAINQPAAYNQIFNIGGDHHCSVNDVARKVFKALGTDTGIRYLPERRETKHIYSSHEKIKRVLGSSENVDLESGIQRMVQWAKKHGARETKDFAAIEIERNLPEFWRTPDRAET
jgi:UDP-glucose 4-epimerase